MIFVFRLLLSFLLLLGVYALPSVADAAVHNVLPGESLYSISLDYGISLDSLKEANGMQDSLIYPGDKLNIPESSYSGEGSAEKSVSGVSRGENSQSMSSRADADLLARLISAEAEGEPYEGKVAVGAVVLNRLYSGYFPESLEDVIYQYDDGTYQFEPVMNGWINYPASTQSLQAARDALNGVDPTNGALYFFAGSKVNNGWLWSRPVSTVIGDVVFTY